MKILLLANICFVSCLFSCASNPPQNQTSSARNSAPTPSPAEVTSPTAPPSSNDNSETTVKIRKIVANTLALEPNEIDINAPLSKLKKPADELDVVEIIMSVEEEFNIEIKDDELGGGDINAATNITVKQIADLVAKRKKRG